MASVRDHAVTRRLGVIALCLVAFVGCLGLAWWQFTRYESATGDWQNFGYMLLWPIFGVFPTFMVWRLRRLRIQEPPAEKQPPLTPEPPKPPRIVAVQDEADDPELAAYNRYLAKLNALDQQETR